MARRPVADRVRGFDAAERERLGLLELGENDSYPLENGRGYANPSDFDQPNIIRGEN